MDITMLVYFGSRERTIGEWIELLNTADPRFVLRRATGDPRQPNTILEIGWQDDERGIVPGGAATQKL